MYLITYDIRDDKVRSKFSKFIERFGIRIQYSVFSIVNSRRILSNIKIELDHVFKKMFSQGDSVLIYMVPDDSCISKFGYPEDDEGDLVMR